ncbi:Armadillo repeat-containing protein 3 and Serine/threonine-protein kinase CTR1 [Cynara cardunculus var. scolymus]|uniref:peptidylprolyl isomerase n=1 Tax=Cynara cardunculus var. scolymus TaxID=59895 RepID=A0A103Y8S3_CYNCS|nr:Armadillo repeat-containing protein 3 and Serine/threonine-protein kinase CTR1 [Cynara cardunculus var. scolymus]
MKNLLKKLHIMPNQTSDMDSEGSTSSSSKGNQKLIDVSPSIESLPQSQSHEHHKPLSGISGWLNSVTNRQSPSPSPPSSSNVKIPDKNEEFDSMSSDALDAAMEAVRAGDSGSGMSRDPEVEEEYQIQLALELSAREDPEAVQIEAVKQISLGTCPPENTPAEVLAYRYWYSNGQGGAEQGIWNSDKEKVVKYSALSYDDKILDGFYDLYDISTQALSSKMPSLVDLQGTPLSDNITLEAVLVNKATDVKLLRLEQSALEIAVKSTSESLSPSGHNMVQRLAALVSNHMGGPVGDPDKMLLAWRNFSYKLKATLGSIVLPLGSLKVGMACHRALLFKVLADSVGIPCRLVKGKQYTGSSDVAMNFINIGDGREYIVDLMADPGTLIPSDTAGGFHVDREESSFSSSPWSRDDDSSRLTSRGGLTSSSDECSVFGMQEKTAWFSNLDSTGDRSDDGTIQHTRSSGLTQQTKPEQVPKKCLPLVPYKIQRENKVGEIPLRASHHSHARSPSWTEGVSSPAARKMKVKDVSQYMIDAAKENPQLAQKLHDVLLESGVVAPPNLFTEVYDEQEDMPLSQDKEENSKWDRKRTTEGQGERVSDRSTGNDSTKSEVSLEDVADCEIAWEDITLGSYGEVYRGDWHGTAMNFMASPAYWRTKGEGIPFSGSIFHICPRCSLAATALPCCFTFDFTLLLAFDLSLLLCLHRTVFPSRILAGWIMIYIYLHSNSNFQEVAVKKFLDQEITVESLEEFKSEVGIMKRVRHPNVVLFMGAVTRAPHLSIVTEFLPRGSLYRLIHRPNNQLDIRRRLRIALDAARGMNYLHNCTPIIVHRDLKSPNLLVDKNWVVKAEWMAPEVLRNEPSDENFGVILWELCTLQQPWGGMNPMQVVGAVGFQHRRLEIPDDVDPAIADVIRRCWQTDPRLRPSFSDIMSTLKPLQKPITIRTQHLSSSSQPPPPLPPSQPPLQQPPLIKTSQELQPPLPVASAQGGKARSTSADSTDWIASSLTRRFGLGAGLAWAGFLAFGVVSEQIKTRLEVNQQEANTRDVEMEEEVVLPNGIRYNHPIQHVALLVGGGATPRKGDLVVIDIKGNVEDGVFVDTFGKDKKPLALVVGSRPYSKGMCEGIEMVLKSMKNGGKRRVIVPPALGFGDEGVDFGTGIKIPPSATLEYILEVEKVSIAPS